MSVVLVTPDHYGAIRRTVRHLLAQAVRSRLELIIVAPSADKLDLDESELSEFHQFRVVEVGEIRSTGQAIAAGIRRASAPVVTYAEEHSYPDSGWAAALIEAHRQPWAAVGSVIGNANPNSTISWAHFYTDFGPYVEPAAAVETVCLGGHHTAYKRAILLEYGPMLDAMLENEVILNRDLHARGYRLYLEPRARAHHVNISLFTSHLRAEYNGGRLFGATRARHGQWSIFHRLLYIGAMPLIPLVRLWRVLGEIRRSGRQRTLLPRVLPALIIGLFAHSIGEVTGYALGAGDAAQRRVTFELNRYRHIAERDKQVLAGW